jgi:hypothetical protein
MCLKPSWPRCSCRLIITVSGVACHQLTRVTNPIELWQHLVEHFGTTYPNEGDHSSTLDLQKIFKVSLRHDPVGNHACPPPPHEFATVLKVHASSGGDLASVIANNRETAPCPTCKDEITQSVTVLEIGDCVMLDLSDVAHHGGGVPYRIDLGSSTAPLELVGICCHEGVGNRHVLIARFSNQWALYSEQYSRRCSLEDASNAALQRVPVAAMYRALLG